MPSVSFRLRLGPISQWAWASRKLYCISQPMHLTMLLDPPGKAPDGGIGSMTTFTEAARREESAALRWGVFLMTLGAIAFIGYGVIFFVLNFTDSFLELGIGSDQVASGKDEIKAFDNDLYHYISHLHIALSGFIAATGLAVAALSWFGVRRRYMWAWVAAVAAPVLALAVALRRITRGGSTRSDTLVWSTSLPRSLWLERFSPLRPHQRDERLRQHNRVGGLSSVFGPPSAADDGGRSVRLRFGRGLLARAVDGHGFSFVVFETRSRHGDQPLRLATGQHPASPSTMSTSDEWLPAPEARPSRQRVRLGG